MPPQTHHGKPDSPEGDLADEVAERVTAEYAADAELLLKK